MRRWDQNRLAAGKAVSLWRVLPSFPGFLSDIHCVLLSFGTEKRFYELNTEGITHKLRICVCDKVVRGRSHPTCPRLQSQSDRVQLLNADGA